jgi:microtubule-associated protein-like 6
MAMLEVLKGGRDQLPESFAILKTRTTIGRDAKCDVTLEWDGMSRKHAEIEGQGSDIGFSTSTGGQMHTAFRVRDCGSSNGVFVNNVKVNESVLRDGDRVAFGRGRAVRVGEAAPERYFEYVFVFRTLKLRGQKPSRETGPKGSDGPIKGHKYPPCKSHLYPESGWPDGAVNHRAPDAELELEWVHGYRCASAVVHDTLLPVPGQCENLSNLKFLTSNRIAYPAACVVVVYDMSAHTQSFMQAHDDDCICLAVNPTREVACSGQVASMTQRDPPVYVWRTDNLTVLAKLQGFHKRRVTCLAFSPTSQFIASVGGDDAHSVAVYDWRSQSLVFCGSGALEEVYSLSFNPDNMDEFLQVGGKHVKFWSFESQSSMMSAMRQANNMERGWKQADPQIIYCCTYTADGLAAVGLHEGHIFFFTKLKPSNPNECKYRINEAHIGPVLSLCSFQGGIASGGRDGWVKIWGASAGRPKASRSGGSQQTSSRGSKESGSNSAKVKVDLKEMAGEQRLSMAATSLDYVNGQLLCGTSVGSIVIVSIRESEPPTVTTIVLAHARGINGCAASPCGYPYFMTASDDRTIRRWSMIDRQLEQSVSVGMKATAIAISPDDRLYAVGHRAGRFTVWDAPQPPEVPRCIVKYTQRTEDITDIKFSPDGRLLAAANREQSIDIFDIHKDFSRIATCIGHSGAVLHIDFSEDGRYLRSSDTAGEILFWHAATGKQHARGSEMRDVLWWTSSVVFGWALQGVWAPGSISSDIDSVAVSHDQYYCVSGGDTGCVTLYQYPVVGNPKVIQGLGRQSSLHSSHITGLCFTEDDAHVISSSADGVAAQWRVKRHSRAGNQSRVKVHGFHPGHTRAPISSCILHAFTLNRGKMKFWYMDF